MTALPSSPESWLLLLADGALKSSAVFLVALLAVRALRRQSAAVRHMIWTAALACSLALPLVTAMLPAWRLDVLSAVTSVAASPATGSAAAAGGALPATVIRALAEAPRASDAALVLLLLWATGFVAVVSPLLAGIIRLVRTASSATPLFVPRWMRLAAELSRSLGLDRPVRLLEDRRASMPVTWGVMRPRVLLPAGAERWPEERMRVVLAHELAHVRRRDWLVQVAGEIGRAVYWFNPLIWIGCDRLRRESEHACDDAVINSGIGAPDYAEHLLELARTLPSSERAWSVALAMARQSNLERRFIAMLNPCLNRANASRKAAFTTVLVALVLMLPLAALRLPAQSAAGQLIGTIHDASGAAVPNATIIVSNPSARTKDMTATNRGGAYEFRNLPLGQYEMEVLHPGFARLRIQVALPSGQTVIKDATMEVGRASEVVNVVGKSAARAVRAEPAPVSVGGSLQETKILKMVRPAYPQAAKDSGIEGAVLLEAVVGKDGNLHSLRVMNSQIDPDLAKAAVEAVSQWQYRPTLLNGAPVEVITSIDINFTLAP
jgi:TonB family protein